MRRGWTLPFILLTGGLPGCEAGVSRGDMALAKLQVQSAREEAKREHARLLEMETRMADLERRLAKQARACGATRDPRAADVEGARGRPKTEPLRSEGDFLTEARVSAPATAPPARSSALGAATAEAPASEQERLQRQLEGLREYTLDQQSGLSFERREALRVLLRKDRQLDLMNPWADH